MADLSDKAHKRAKQMPMPIKEAVDRWLEAADILDAIQLAVVSYEWDNEVDDEPSLVKVHTPAVSKRGEVVPDCGLLDPNVQPVIVSGRDDIAEWLGLPDADEAKCEVCFDD